MHILNLDEITINLVTFYAGDFCIGVEASQIKESLTDINIAGKKTRTIESLLNIAQANPYSVRQWLRIVPDKINTETEYEYLLEVSAPVTLVSLQALSFHALPTLLAAKCKWNFLVGLCETEYGIIPILQLQKLIQNMTEKNYENIIG